MSESKSGFDQIGWYCPQCSTFTHENCKMDGMADEKHAPVECFISNLAPQTETPTWLCPDCRDQWIRAKIAPAPRIERPMQKEGENEGR